MARPVWSQGVSGSFGDRQYDAAVARHRVAVLLQEQVLPLDFAIPMHVFAREAPEFYDVRTAC